MSKIAVNEITDEVGTGSPAFTNGLAQSDIAGALNATGTAPIYACRAWLEADFSGNIVDSGNVSSTTQNGTGVFTINFANSMPSADYVTNVTALGSDSSAGNQRFGAVNPGIEKTQNFVSVSITENSPIQFSNRNFYVSVFC